MANNIGSPFEMFTDTSGNPLEDGYLYIGTAGLNPETNPVAVYWDDGLTLAAAQPIRTLNAVGRNRKLIDRRAVDAVDCLRCGAASDRHPAKRCARCASQAGAVG